MRIAVLALALLTPLPLARANDLWIVDADDLPGADFTAIQPAIDAAADGDTIYVRGKPNGPFTGLQHYDGFTVAGRSLTIVAQGVAPLYGVRIDSTVVVRDTAPGQTVTLRGLAIRPVSPSTHALRVVDCEGEVWLEDLGANFDPAVTTPEAVRIVRSGSVVASRLFATGNMVLFADGQSAPSPGLVAVDSTVLLYACQVRGGDGGHGVAPHGPGDGAPALLLEDSTVLVDAGTIEGGDGGNSAHFPGGCLGPGVGGPAVLATGNPSLVRIDSNSVAAGETGNHQNPCTSPPPTADVVGATPHFGPPGNVQILSTAVQEPGNDLVLRFAHQGIPAGDFLFVMGADRPDTLLLPDGGLVLPGTAAIEFVGLVAEIPLQSYITGYAGLGPGIDSVVGYVQAAILDAAGTSVTLSAPSAIVFLGAELP